jgi:hypothetical protein
MQQDFRLQHGTSYGLVRGHIQQSVQNTMLLLDAGRSESTSSFPLVAGRDFETDNMPHHLTRSENNNAVLVECQNGGDVTVGTITPPHALESPEISAASDYSDDC